MKGKEAENSEDPKEMLKIDLRAEQETVKTIEKELSRLNKQVSMHYQKF